MSNQSLFDRVSSLVAEIESEKTAAVQEKRGMKDPGGYEGPSSHPTTKADDDELETAPEGAQSADNTKIVKEEIPEAVDAKPDATPSNVPKSDDTQLGQGVDKAKATGEDPASEEDYQGKPTGDKREGDMGGTTHPADGTYGEKYSSEKLAEASDNDLLKLAADLGNEVASDLTNGHFSQPQQLSPEQAAQAGANLAKTAGEVTPDQLAAAVIEHQVKAAHHQADLVAGHLSWELDTLQKAAMEGEDPTGGEAEGEDNGSEEGEYEEGGEMPPEGGGEEMPPEGGEGGGAEELLAAMGGEGGGMPPEAGMGGPEMGMGGGPEMGMGGGPEMGGLPPEMGMGGGPEMGGMGGPEMGGMGGPEMGGMGGMGGDEGVQQLAMALLELGIDPAQLAAAASDTGQKMASAVQMHKRAGKFRVGPPQNRQQKQARDYMRGYVLELLKRNG